MKYQNTFEMFGDPCPAECESAEQFAESILHVFERNGVCYVERPPLSDGGLPTEVEWKRRVWDAALEEFAPLDDEPKYSSDMLEIPIDRKLLLRFLVEAVEEVG